MTPATSQSPRCSWPPPPARGAVARPHGAAPTACPRRRRAGAARRHAGADRAVPVLAGRRRARGAGAGRRAAQRQVVPRGGDQVDAVRARLRRAHRRRALPGHRQRHQRADHLALRARRRARATRSSCRPTPSSPPSTPSCCCTPCPSSSTPTSRPSRSTRARSRPPSPTGTRAIMPVHLGGSAGRPRHDPEARTRAQRPRDRGRLPGPPGRVAGPQGRHLRHGRAASASRPARTSTPARAARSSPTTRRWSRRCYALPQQQPRPRATPATTSRIARRARNLRMTEFQARAALGADDAPRGAVEARATTNAAYLTSLLKEIPGITPARHVRGLHAQRVPPLHVPLRRRALRRAAAGGVPQGATRRRRPGLRRLLAAQQGAVPRGGARLSRASSASTVARRWLAAGASATSARRTIGCAREAVWLTQTMLLGPRRDMDQIADAVRKVQAHAARLS